MEPVVGVFANRQEAEEATEPLNDWELGQITLLTPDDWKEKVRSVRTEDMEQPGIGAALCGLVGAGPGTAAGLVFGTFADAVLGVAGAAAGIAAGRALETSLCDGLPKDDLYTYIAALRQGRSVVIAFADTAPSALEMRLVMTRAGASLDPARKGWWFGRRVARKHYRTDGLVTEHGRFV